MPHKEPGKIRNVAVIGHRGTGKTSLVEALLYQSGAINRLGSVADGTTVADYDEDEKQRGMSIRRGRGICEWNGRKINLIDTPGEPSFLADVLGALRVVEGAIVTVSRRDGRRGGHGAAVAPLRRAGACSRLVLVNMLDRERADFCDRARVAAGAALRPAWPSRSRSAASTSSTAWSTCVHMVAYMHGDDASGHDEAVPIPDELRERLTSATTS